MISIDTLRADHLGCYGYARDTSPFIDSLAARGVVFENAIVQLPGTLPSHMSMFTGLYPAEHGVYPPNGILSSEIETLPEVFQRHGFATAGFTEGGYVDGHYGFSRGFDRFSDETAGTPTDVETTFSRGLEFLSELAPEEPFLLFLHTYAVHDPYDPPAPHRSLFWDRDPPETFEPTGPNLVAVNRGRRQVTPEAVEYFRALYDAGIHYVDAELRRFFSGLEALGLDDQVTVVVTSDHGEEFLEHGSLVHEQIYDETLHVPLIVLRPGSPGGRRVASLVEGIDVAPSLYELAAVPPPRPMSGKSWVPLLTGVDSETRDEAYAESHDRAARTLYRRTEDGLFQLLRFDPAAESDGLWVSREIAFDVFEGELSFEARSYHRPRRIQVRLDGTAHAEIELDTTPTRVRLPLAAGRGQKRVTLAASSCDSPASLGTSSDRRCLAFRIKGTSLKRLELYDLIEDRAASRDLSSSLPAVTRDLHRRLADYPLAPVASSVAAPQREIDPELAVRLKALGYLE